MKAAAVVRCVLGVAIAGVATFATLPAQAQTIGLPTVPGVYVTLGGGGQDPDSPSVAAFGELSSQQSGNLGGASSGAASFAGTNTSASASTSAAVNAGEGAGAATAAATDTTAAAAASGAGAAPGTGSGAAAAAAGGNNSAAAASSANGGNQSTAQAAGSGPQAAAATSAAAPGGSATASASPNGGRTIDPDTGTWLTGSVGYAFAMGGGIMGAVEVYGRHNKADEDLSILGAAGFRAVDNQAVFAAAATPIGNLTTSTGQEVRLSEFGVRLKANAPGGVLPLIFGLEPFYIHYEQETETTSRGSAGGIGGIDASRRSDVDGRLYGVQAALETQVPLFGQSLFWLARGSGGFYRIEAEGDFSSEISIASFGGNLDSARVADDVGDWGYRAGAETGIRVVFNPSLALSLTGGVDYLSDMPTAVLPRFGGEDAAHVEMDDLTIWKFGGQLTFSFGGP